MGIKYKAKNNRDKRALAAKAHLVIQKKTEVYVWVMHIYTTLNCDRLK